MSTILIVDDDRPNSRALAELLRRAGHRADCAAGAGEAMDFLRHTRPDLVLLDVMMSGTASGDAGIRLLRDWRADVRLRDLRVVMFSAVADQGVLGEAEQLGALDYFVKSRFDWPQIRERIDALLRRGAGAWE